jgi:RNA polymerase sigma-70 factor (ECF subfamily)
VAHRAGRLRRYARALTRNVSRSDDLVQDTLARAREGASLGAGTDMRRGYSPSCIIRTSMQSAALSVKVLHSISRQLSWSLVATTDPTAARQLHELDWALAQMPEEQRQVILLVGLECHGIRGPQKSLTCRSGQSVRARPGCAPQRRPSVQAPGR